MADFLRVLSLITKSGSYTPSFYLSENNDKLIYGCNVWRDKDVQINKYLTAIKPPLYFYALLLIYCFPFCRSGKCFVFTVSHLSAANSFDVDNIETILNEVNKSDLSDLKTDQGLARAIEFIFHLNVPLFSNAHLKMNVETYFTRNRVLTLNTLFHALNIDFLCYINEIPIKTTLENGIRLKLVKFFQGRFRNTAERKRPVSYNDGLYGKGRNKSFSLSHHQSLLNHVRQDIETSLNTPGVQIDFALPISTSQQVIIKKNNVHDKMKNSDGSWQSLINTKDNKLVLLLPKKTEINYHDEKLYGRICVEAKILKKLNIPYSVINWRKYEDAIRYGTQISYIKNIL